VTAAATLEVSSDLLRGLPSAPLFVDPDDGGRYEVIDSTTVEGVGFARGFITGTLVRFEQTGHAVKHGQVRCKLVEAVDPGRADDTVVFPLDRTFGGLMPAGLAVDVDRWS